MLLVVVEDALDGLDTWIIVALVVLTSALLVPVKDLSEDISVKPDDVGELDRRNNSRGRQRVRSG